MSFPDILTTIEDLDKIREKVWGKQEQAQEQQKQERKDYAK
jgi:hypothetical protein